MQVLEKLLDQVKPSMLPMSWQSRDAMKLLNCNDDTGIYLPSQRRNYVVEVTKKRGQKASIFLDTSENDWIQDSKADQEHKQFNFEDVIGKISLAKLPTIGVCSTQGCPGSIAIC